MSYKHWRLEQDEQNIAWLTFDRDGMPVNTLSKDVLTELDQILETLKGKLPAGLAILSGKQKGFIAGADITQFTHLKTADEAFDLIRQAQIIFDKLEAMPFPSISCIDGFCLGGGTELSLACTYRLATDSDSTKIGLPEVKLGIHPGWGGTVRLPLLIGAPNAMKVMLTGRSFSGKQMKRLGVVDACVPLRELKRVAIHYLLNQPAKQRPKWPMSMANTPWLRPLFGNIFYNALRKQKLNKSHYPAPYAIIRNWIRDGARGNAMINEAKSIAELMVGDTARNLVRVFFLQSAMKDLAKGSQFSPKHVHVIGAGTMGGDIAAYCAYKGFNVTLQDQSAERIAPAMARAYKLYKKKLKKPRLIQRALDRLQADVDGYGIASADLIIEAVFEDLSVKQEIFKQVESQAKKSAVMATNTSSIPLEEIASVLSQPDRLVGIHFFNPVAKMPLVEVVRGKQTSEAVLKDAARFVTKISRSPVIVKSSPGFLVNRILMPYLMEAMLLLEEGYAPHVIDKAAVHFGMPMGPVALADLVGLDVCLSVAKELAEVSGAQVPARLTQMVESGSFGVKSGQGFYTYKDGKVVRSNESVSEPRNLDVIQDRLILTMVNEAVACLSEGVVTDVDMLDAGMIFGTGFAPFTGGPMQYAKARGYAEVQRTLATLAEKFGDRFAPHSGWAQLSDLTVEPNANYVEE